MFYKYRIHFIIVSVFIIGLVVGLFFPFRSQAKIEPIVTDIYTINQKVYLSTNQTNSDYNFGIYVNNANVLVGQEVNDHKILDTFVIDTKNEIEEDFQIVIIDKKDNAELFNLDKRYQLELGKYRYVYNPLTATFKKKDIDQNKGYNTKTSMAAKSGESNVVIGNYYENNDGKFISVTNTNDQLENQYINFKAGNERIKYEIANVYTDNGVTKVVYKLANGSPNNITVYLKVGAGSEEVEKQKSLIVALKAVENIDDKD